MISQITFFSCTVLWDWISNSALIFSNGLCPILVFWTIWKCPSYKCLALPTAALGYWMLKGHGLEILNFYFETLLGPLAHHKLLQRWLYIRNRFRIRPHRVDSTILFKMRLMYLDWTWICQRIQCQQFLQQLNGISQEFGGFEWLSIGHFVTRLLTKIAFNFLPTFNQDFS
jgi:hypothetical protein